MLPREGPRAQSLWIWQYHPQTSVQKMFKYSLDHLSLVCMPVCTWVLKVCACVCPRTQLVNCWWNFASKCLMFHVPKSTPVLWQVFPISENGKWNLDLLSPETQRSSKSYLALFQEADNFSAPPWQHWWNPPSSSSGLFRWSPTWTSCFHLCPIVYSPLSTQCILFKCRSVRSWHSSLQWFPL